jgi:hypothetical protein
MNKEMIKQKMKHEMYRMLIYFAFLSLFFCSLTAYERIILGEYSISYLHYGYGLLQALILSKIILIGESLRLGERFEDRPLMIPTLYKTIIFSIFTFLFLIIEHFVTGFFHGIGFAEISEEIANKSLNVILAKTLVIFWVFILFFAFLEIGNFLGENKLIKLFFQKHPKTDKN